MCKYRSWGQFTGQTVSKVPADKKLVAIRSVTGKRKTEIKVRRDEVASLIMALLEVSELK